MDHHLSREGLFKWFILHPNMVLGTIYDMDDPGGLLQVVVTSRDLHTDHETTPCSPTCVTHRQLAAELLCSSFEAFQHDVWPLGQLCLVAVIKNSEMHCYCMRDRQ